MELSIKVNVHNSSDVLRYARAGAIPMDLAARTCLVLSGWTEDEAERAVGRKRGVRTGRPSRFYDHQDEVRDMVNSGSSTADLAEKMGISVPTARDWIKKLQSEEGSVPQVEVQEAGAA